MNLTWKKKQRRKKETNSKQTNKKYFEISTKWVYSKCVVPLDMCSGWANTKKKTLKMEANIYINLEINFGPFNQKHVKLFDAFEWSLRKTKSHSYEMKAKLNVEEEVDGAERKKMGKIEMKKNERKKERK